LWALNRARTRHNKDNIAEEWLMKGERPRGVSADVVKALKILA